MHRKLRESSANCTRWHSCERIASRACLEAMRDFCDARSLLPRGVKLTAEDVWERCSYLLSVKLDDPQFAGQTKERLSSRECTTFVSGVVRDAFSQWLHQHVDMGERIAELAIQSAQTSFESEQESCT